MWRQRLEYTSHNPRKCFFIPVAFKPIGQAISRQILHGINAELVRSHIHVKIIIWDFINSGSQRGICLGCFGYVGFPRGPFSSCMVGLFGFIKLLIGSRCPLSQNPRGIGMISSV